MLLQPTEENTEISKLLPHVARDLRHRYTVVMDKVC